MKIFERNNFSKSVLSAGALLLAAGTAPATAASVPPHDPHPLVHLDFGKGQLPENVAEAPGGAFNVTFAKAAEIAEISATGDVRILATLPKPVDGGATTPALGFALASGIVRDHDGTLYFLYATGTSDLTGFWRLRRGGRPERIAALPAKSLPNGLALDSKTRTLYATDSVGSTIWKVSTRGGTATAWSTAPELAATGFLGANGLKIRNGAIWATNLDKGTVLRIPFQRDGSAGPVRTVATGLEGIDDIAFTGCGDELLAALVAVNQVALVQSDGSHEIVLTAADGLQNPTSISVRGNTVYVFSAAYLTQQDPNVIVAQFRR